jgi:beta-N-acetylhexosaminidase
MRLTLLFLALLLSLNATQVSNVSDEKLKKMIGKMLVIGFSDNKVDENSPIIKQINKYDLGGVILFDRFMSKNDKQKNIVSPEQVKKLTADLQRLSNKPILISIDQEGGKVSRLRKDYGFEYIPSAHAVGKKTAKEAEKIYQTQAKMLAQAGLNTNFAPVVDLAINPKNKVIVGLKRAYSSSATKVSAYAKICIDAQSKEGIISVLKHFPGHGSSLGDSHKGFVDITQTWSKKELEPYKNLIASNSVDMIMTAHVFNAHLDKNYPATLSYNVNTKLLRQEMAYRGVIISDDMQMQAISKHYSVAQAVTLAINAGVDILLFGNQLSGNQADTLVNTIFAEVKKGNIPYSRLVESNARIDALYTKIAIKQKPIDFGKKRIEMTKEYIKNHYALKVQDITIKPKIITLHWTADMGLESSFARLKNEKLFSDRPDIIKASALNVSAHFLVARDGTIYQLMPDNWMARHVIGLNYSTIGIENVGGKHNKEEDLTPAQVQANIDLVNYLKQKYPSIEYLIGHHEYRAMETTPLWLEKDAGYRTQKADPGESFMQEVRKGVKNLGLKKP